MAGPEAARGPAKAREGQGLQARWAGVVVVTAFFIFWFCFWPLGKAGCSFLAFLALRKDPASKPPPP